MMIFRKIYFLGGEMNGVVAFSFRRLYGLVCSRSQLSIVAWYRSLLRYIYLSWHWSLLHNSCIGESIRDFPTIDIGKFFVVGEIESGLYSDRRPLFHIYADLYLTYFDLILSFEREKHAIQVLNHVSTSWSYFVATCTIVHGRWEGEKNESKVQAMTKNGAVWHRWWKYFYIDDE